MGYFASLRDANPSQWGYLSLIRLLAASFVVSPPSPTKGKNLTQRGPLHLEEDSRGGEAPQDSHRRHLGTDCPRLPCIALSRKGTKERLDTKGSSVSRSDQSRSNILRDQPSWLAHHLMDLLINFRCFLVGLLLRNPLGNPRTKVARGAQPSQLQQTLLLGHQLEEPI
jgi:hypothetical protein